MSNFKDYTSNPMSAAQYWWKIISPAQRDYILDYYSSTDILVRDVINAAFKKQQNIGWNREHGWPESIMRII